MNTVYTNIGLLDRLGDLSPVPRLGDLSAADVEHMNSSFISVFEAMQGEPIGIHTAG